MGGAGRTFIDIVTKEKIAVVKASTPEHKHDTIQDNCSRVEVFYSVYRTFSNISIQMWKLHIRSYNVKSN